MTKEDRAIIINYLRMASVITSGRKECLRRASVTKLEGYVQTGPNKGNPKYKTYWRCADCDKLFRDIQEMQVDHIVEVGNLDDLPWNVVVPKIICEVDNLQCLCVACHLKKTQAFSCASVKYERKKP